jgi:molybdopterin-biosynthesis enzyme MoeA-like protein
LFVIGNEILDGRRTDCHFAAAQRLLRERHHGLAYALYLPDDNEVIETQLRWAMARPEPFFSCGGIGSTPDDLTRGCAARAAGVGLELHPEGVEILKGRFGKEATPARLRMVEFPVGSVLIPNPVNQVPGFRIGRGHFVPGFPDMAASMMAWVLDNWYVPAPRKTSRAFTLPGAREADLVDLMEDFMAAHPAVSFSSLPRFTGTGTEVVLGLAGLPGEVERAARTLTDMLARMKIPYQEEPEHA